MDRTADTAAFMLVRTDGIGNPQKTFVVGANSSGAGVGTFVINDLGTAVSGGGTNRMTINNDGSVTFTGNVYANSFVPSSIAYKDNVRTYENALDTVNKLRGVRFDWKDSGKPSVGLIAEEVEKVVPEVVAHDEGNATGVNYASLVGVLVEAVKEQQAQHHAELTEQKKQHQVEMDSLRAEIQQLKTLLQGR
jgi:microcompartment protein CcmK/EutM